MQLSYTDLYDLKHTYDNTERWIIAANIRALLKRNDKKVYNLVDILGISKHNAYAYTKEKGYAVKADLYNLLTLAAYFDISPMIFFAITGDEQ